MPTNAERQLPPITAHGCAIGLEGRTKSKKALAPIEATIHGDESPEAAVNAPSPITASKPRTTPNADRSRSDHETELASGKKPLFNLLSNSLKRSSLI